MGQSSEHDPDDSKTSMNTSRRRLLQMSAGAVVLGPVGIARAQEATPMAEPEPAINPVVPFPAPGSKTASPGTQIIFRGLPQDEIGAVAIVGSKSGDHTGIWISHKDGNGASLKPDRPFLPGETVSIRTRMDIRGTENGDYEFTVCVPRSVRIEPDANDAEIEGTVSEFRSRPGLRPPIVTATSPGEGIADGLLFLAPKNGAGRNGALIAEPTGDPVWFLPVDVADSRIYAFQVQTWKGQPALTYWYGFTGSGHGYGHYLIKDNRYETVAEFQVGNGYLGGDPQEFLITPSETALIIISNVIEWDLGDIGGSKSGYVVDNIVQELEIESGAVLYEWHCLDHVPFADSQVEFAEDEDEYDYFHLNSAGIDFDGSVIVSGRNTWSCYLLHRVTGDVIWRLGGKSSDFALNEGVETAWQNDFRAFPGNVYTIFDNGAAPKVHPESRGIRVALDLDAMTAELQEEYVHPNAVLSRSQGNMQTLANGNILIGWGNEPRASEFSADGALLQDWTFPEGRESYRTYKFPWNGQPTDPPTLAVLRDENEALNAYVSWNGDTQTRSWRLNAGATRDVLTTRATIDRAGFETTIPVSANDLFFAAEALNENGDVIGISNVVAISD